MQANKSLVTEIQGAVDTAASVAEVIAPQYAVFIVLGQALAHAAPELVDDVKALIGKAEPTDADVQVLADKIASLANPAAL